MPPSTAAIPRTRRELRRGIWPTGAATAAAYFAAGTLLTLAGVDTGNVVPPVVDAPAGSWILILLLGCTGLLFRRRNVPLMLALTGSAVVASVLAGGGILTYLLAFEVFYAGILFGSPRLSRAVEKTCLLTAAVLAAGVGVVYRDWTFVLFGVLQAIIICLVPLWWAGTLRRQTDLAEQERLRADTEQRNAEQAAEVADLFLKMALASERAAMARDLHDAIAGRLSAVALQSAAALAGADPDLDRRVLAQVRTESVQALNDMRAMIDLLESGSGELSGEAALAAGGLTAVPDQDSMAGGLDQLQGLAESARLAGNPVELEVSPELAAAPEAQPAGLPLLVQSSVYRIVQETLTNAVRHAPGEPVRVQVRQTPRDILLTVTNTLPPVPDPAEVRTPEPGAVASEPAGAAVAAGNGTGLRNMALRAAQLSGSFSAGRVRDDAGDAAAGNGGTEMWEVRARLPLAGSALGGSPLGGSRRAPVEGKP